MIQATQIWSKEVFLLDKKHVEVGDLIIKYKGYFFGYVGFFKLIDLDSNQLKLNL